MKIFITAAALLLAAGAASYAQTPADIPGTWDVTVTTAQGPMPTSTMVLKKDGEKIIGTIAGPQGEIGVEAEVKDKAVSLWASIDTGSGPIDITFTGTADGNSMKGTVDFGGRGGGDWTATRSAAQPAPAAAAQAAPAAPQDKPEKVDITGTWAFEVTTDMGTGNSTMALKQDGEKLSGQYTCQYGQAALTGTIKGNEFTFSYDLAGESATVHVVYAGTVDKDTMKGTITIGDMGTGTFVGKKSK
jgi:hypothetical protein